MHCSAFCWASKGNSRQIAFASGILIKRTHLTLIAKSLDRFSCRSLCGTSEQKRPYGELGSVGKSNSCCCVSVHSGLGEISPGCGCSEDIVDEIVAELKRRMRERGDTAQIKRTEETLKRLALVDAKLVSLSYYILLEIERIGYDWNKELGKPQPQVRI